MLGDFLTVDASSNGSNVAKSRKEKLAGNSFFQHNSNIQIPAQGINLKSRWMEPFIVWLCTHIWSQLWHCFTQSFEKLFLETGGFVQRWP